MVQLTKQDFKPLFEIINEIYRIGCRDSFTHHVII
jgi:hypothetical protein